MRRPVHKQSLLDYETVEQVYGSIFSVEDTPCGCRLLCTQGFNGGVPKCVEGRIISASEAWRVPEWLFTNAHKPIVGAFSSLSGVEDMTRHLQRRFGLTLVRQRASKYRKRWRIAGFPDGGEEEADDPRVCAIQAVRRYKLRYFRFLHPSPRSAVQ